MSMPDARKRTGRWRRMIGGALRPLAPNFSRLTNQDLLEPLHERIPAFWRDAFGRQRVEQLPVIDPVERFQAMMVLNDLSMEDIDLRRRSSRRLFYLYGILAVASAAAAPLGALLMTGQDTQPWGLLLGAVAIALLGLVKTVQFAFYNWVLRTRRFGDFREWVNTPAAWWPR